MNNIFCKKGRCYFAEHSHICDDDVNDVIKENKMHSCCIFGHRKIAETEKLKSILYKVIENLIVKENIHIFLFGSKSQFNDLCLRVVTGLKEKYPNVKRIYVRAEFPHINDDYRDYLLQTYDVTYYPKKMINAGKASYVERNYEMIDNSKFCVIYYDENYKPPRRKNSSRELNDYQPKSGTKLAYDYAKRKGLKIINTIDL